MVWCMGRVPIASKRRVEMGYSRESGRLCLLLAALFPLLAPVRVSAGLETGIQIDVGGQSRSYDLYVPDGLGNQLRPLVIDMHGHSARPEDQRRQSGFKSLSDSEKFIVAWPLGRGSEWNAFFGAAGTDDVGAIRAIVTHIASSHDIDPKRIYATGWSQGGEMGYRLACDAADMVAAIASVAGPVRVGSEPNCDPIRPIAVLSFRGRDDGIVPFAGGFIAGTNDRVLSASLTHDLWKEINGCQGADQNQTIGGASCNSNSQCGGDVAVTSCVVEGGGRPENHNLYTSPDADIARESWKFFQAFTLPELQDSFVINAGLNDAWYNPETNGQGFLITVLPDTGIVFLAWFTYDLERPPQDVTAMLGEPGHRWLTAQGPYEGNTASLTIYVTEGGVFDAAEPAAVTDSSGDGSMTVEFASCSEGLLSYEIDSLGISSEIPIQRIVPDNIPLCENLGAE